MTARSDENRPSSSSSLLSIFSTSRTSDKYQLLHENIDQAFLVVTLPKGQIVDANLNSVRMLGHTRAELCNIKLNTLIEHTNLDNTIDAILLTPTGTRTTYDMVPIRIRSGETKNFNLQCFRSHNNEQLILIFMYDANDSTSSKANNKNDVGPLIALESLTDLLQNPTDDNIVISTTICKSLLDAEEVAIYTAELEPGFGLLASTNSDNVFPEYIAATDDCVGTSLFTWKNGSMTQSIFARVARNKGYEVVLVQPLGYETSCTGMLVAVFRKGNQIDDITEIRLSVAARILNSLLELGGHWQSAVVHTSEIETLEQHWHTLMETTGDGIFSVSTEGDISRVNSLAGTLLGYQLDEIQHMHISDVLVASPPVVGTIQKSREQRETYTSHNVTLIRRDGQEIHVLLRAVPIFDKNR
ncbi:MAG: PAS domain-containing protein, partial [Chloroflexota bacterium]|nr:PAS domain-containing protein [Chloroflexota bacterium]